MAALTITVANVRVVSNTTPVIVTAGEALTQGMAVYRDASTGKWYKTDATDTDKDQVEGVALTPADADGDQFVLVQTVGAVVDIGATTVKGTVYYAGATAAGSWNPASDLATPAAVLPGLLAEDTAGTCSLILFNAATPVIL